MYVFFKSDGHLRPKNRPCKTTGTVRKYRTAPAETYPNARAIRPAGHPGNAPKAAQVRPECPAGNLPDTAAGTRRDYSTTISSTNRNPLLLAPGCQAGIAAAFCATTFR